MNEPGVLSVDVMAHASVPGGLLVHLGTLATGLAERGVRVRAILSESPAVNPVAAELEARGVEVVRLTVRGKFDLSGMRRLRQLVARRRPDVFHVHLSAPYESIPAMLAARAGAAGVLVTTEHAPTFAPTERRYSRFLKRRVAQAIAATIAVSRSDGRFLVEELGLPTERVFVVPNGVSDFSGGPSRGDARHLLGLPEPPAPIVGYVGALEPNKGILDLLAAARLPSLAQVTLALAGSGSLEPVVRDEAKVRGGRIVALGALRDIKALLAAVNVFVLPSHHEAMGIAMLEAMSAGLPIVASRVGGVPEALRDGDAGLLVTSGRPEELAAALSKVLGDPNLAAGLGRAARLAWQEEFRIERMIDRTIDVYSGARRGV